MERYMESDIYCHKPNTSANFKNKLWFCQTTSRWSSLLHILSFTIPSALENGSFSTKVPPKIIGTQIQRGKEILCSWVKKVCTINLCYTVWAMDSKNFISKFKYHGLETWLGEHSVCFANVRRTQVWIPSIYVKGLAWWRTSVIPAQT